MGKGRTYSATQVDTFRDCRRKWAHEKIDGRPRPQHKSAAWGERIHTKLEGYLLDGTLGNIAQDSDVGIILPGIQYLPEPGEALLEQRFEMELPGYGKLVGYIDAEYIDEDGTPINYDHKTTADLRWMKTEDDLRVDTQSVIYAARTLEKHQCERVINRWVYYQRNPKKPKAAKVEVEMDLAHVAKQWEIVLEDIQAMHELHESGRKALEIEYNPSACEKYGGCPYQEICGLSPAERIKGYIMQTSLKDRMRNHNKKKKETPPDFVRNEDGTVTANKMLNAVDRAIAKVNPPESEEVDPLKAAAEQAAKPKKTKKNGKVKKSEEVKPASEFRIGVLYVNCLPLKSAPVSFTDLLQRANAAVDKNHSVPHYRLIPDLYGGAPAVFQDLIEEILTRDPVDGLFVDLNTLEGRDAWPVLEKLAGEVVRGL